MSTRPTLSDLAAESPMRFNPGDRVLVRVGRTLSKEQGIAITRSVRKFARCEVRVLILCPLDCSLLRFRGGQIETLMELVEAPPLHSDAFNTATLNCSVVEVLSGDRLQLIPRVKPESGQRAAMRAALVEWAGPDVDAWVD